MNTEYQDILTTIASHPGITSADIAERMEIKGYYSNLKIADASRRVSKIADKLRDKGLVTSEKTKPITGNPVNVWTVIPRAQDVITEAQAAIPRAELVSDETPIHETQTDLSLTDATQNHHEDSLNMAQEMASDMADLALKQETTDETTQTVSTTVEPIALKDMTEIAPEYTADELTDAVLEAAIRSGPEYSFAIKHKSVAFTISGNDECEGNVEMDEDGIMLYSIGNGFFFRDINELDDFWTTLYRTVRSYKQNQAA